MQFLERDEAGPHDFPMVYLDGRLGRDLEFKKVSAVGGERALDLDLAGEHELALLHFDSDFFFQFPARGFTMSLASLEPSAGQRLSGLVGVADEKQSVSVPDRDVGARQYGATNLPPDP